MITRDDFNPPEEIYLKCPQCDLRMESCNLCFDPFDDGDLVSCGKDPEGKGVHICDSCWDDLPSGKRGDDAI